MSVTRVGRGRMALTLLIVLIGVFAGLHTAHAVVVYDSERIPPDVVIDDDVFIAGDTVIVDGTVTGDLFAAGEQVIINGTVGGSLFVAGGTLAVDGDVQGSVYGAGSSLRLGSEANVERNGYYAGYSLETAEGSLVRQDLVATGYQASLAGTVGSDVQGALAALVLAGEVGGDVNVNIAAPGRSMRGLWGWSLPEGAPPALEPGLRVSATAQIGGQLVYTSPEQQAEAIEAEPEEGVIYRPSEAAAEDDRAAPLLLAIGRWILARLRDLMTLLILGGLALWLVPTWLSGAADQVRLAPLPALGWGSVVLIGGYLIAFLLGGLIILIGLLVSFISVGGLAGPIFGIGLAAWGLFFSIFQLLVSWVSKLVVTYLVGRWLLGRLSRESEASAVGALLLGVAIYVVLRAIPILGWLVAAAATLLGLGAIWMLLYPRLRQARPSE